MATYNGASYIAEQLESLANQSYLPFELVVCDDGSTDKTIDIIQLFAERAPFPVRFFQNSQNLGYADNFLKAATLCSGDWVSFCDQDDIWLANKIEDTRKAIGENPMAVMILQNAYLCASDLTHRFRIFPNSIRPGYHSPRSQYGFWVWPGFVKSVRADAMAMNDGYPRPPSYFPRDGTQTHDKWTCMIANAIGGFVVTANPVALYRRHDKSLTGMYTAPTISERVGNSFNVSGEHYSFLSGVAEETAFYLLRLAERSGGLVAGDLRLSAEGFIRIAKIQKLRALIYDKNVSGLGLYNFLRIAINGGYIGPKMVALGWISAIKDLFRSLGLAPLIKKIFR